MSDPVGRTGERPGELGGVSALEVRYLARNDPQKTQQVHPGHSVPWMNSEMRSDTDVIGEGFCDIQLGTKGLGDCADCKTKLKP